MRYLPILLTLIACFGAQQGTSQTYASMEQEGAALVSEVLEEAGISADNSFFEGESPIKMELTFDFKKLRKNKRKDEYLPAEMTGGLAREEGVSGG
ncbi:MAG: hypothetical protein AAF399_12365, partial [Bacteroidota bacterium]